MYTFGRNNPVANGDPTGGECVNITNEHGQVILIGDDGQGKVCDHMTESDTDEPDVTVRPEGDDWRVEEFAREMNHLNSLSSWSEVGVNGLLTADGIRSLPELWSGARGGWSWLKSWRQARRMAQVRAAGKLGEALAGITKNAERIPSATAAYRVPDVLDHTAKIVGEVKNNSGKLSLTKQIRDEISYAQSRGYTFVLFVRTEQFTQKLQVLVDNGAVKVVKF